MPASLAKGTSGPVVEEHVGVERRQRFGVDAIEDGGHRSGAGHPRVDPAFESDEHDGRGQDGMTVELDDVAVICHVK